MSHAENKALYLERNQQAIMTAMGHVIRALMENTDVTEVMLNHDGKIWADYVGNKMEFTGDSLPSAQAETLIRLVSTQAGAECNDKNPSISAVIKPWNARFEGWVPPMVCSPSFVIRKRAVVIYTLDSLVEQGTLQKEQQRFLIEAIKTRKNIVIAGGTGTGKTTFANALLHEISKTSHRVITIEDTLELQCDAPNYLQFLANEDIGVTIRRAVKSSLRARPDRIIVGEVRDGGALELLKAWNTGHNGGIATIHADSAHQALRRLESLVGEVSINPHQDLIGSAVDVVIHIERTIDGRAVKEICEVFGHDGTGYRLAHVGV